MRCDEVAAVLPALLDGESRNLAVERHVESCLRCQAELTRYRRLLRTLQQLRTRFLEPQPGYLAETLVALEEVAERSVIRSALSGKRLAFAGAGTAVATAAATAAVLIARSRRRALPLAG